ncbi:MAG: hypothetical protein ACWGQW_07340 [bacterium]
MATSDDQIPLLQYGVIEPRIKQIFYYTCSRNKRGAGGERRARRPLPIVMVKMSKSSVLFIFIDGLGIAPGRSGSNPLSGFDPEVLRLRGDFLGPFPRSGICIPTDVQLGIGGLPQSATGQTTLFTGINAARKIGYHLQGFPGPSLKRLIDQESLFSKMKKQGYSVTFANAFTPAFFEQRPRRLSATTIMSETAGVPLRDLESKSLYMDFTNRVLLQKGFPVPLRSPKAAADILIDLTEAHNLCLYEYFLTDLVGHRGSFDSAVELLSELDSFLKEIIDALDLSRNSLVISSDHGNIEEMNHRRHTSNPVPTLLWGDIKEVFLPFTSGLKLEQITPLIEEFFGLGV